MLKRVNLVAVVNQRQNLACNKNCDFVHSVG